MTEQELEQTKTRVAELGRRVAHFLDVVKKAGANFRKDGKGMQVPYFGDFASITPSTLHSLEWFARAFAENVDSVSALLLEVERLQTDLKTEATRQRWDENDGGKRRSDYWSDFK